MRCPHCKAENDANAVFCKSCDAWIFGSVYIDKNYTRARRTHLLRWLLPVIGGVLVLATCITLFLWPEPPEASMPVVEIPGFSATTAPGTSIPILPTEPPIEPPVGHHLQVLRNGQSQLAFLIDNTILDTELPVTGVYRDYDFTTSFDQSAAAYRQTFGGNLYYIHNGQLEILSSGVSDYRLSLDGSGIAYRTNDDRLWYFHADQQTPVRIADTVKQYVISPDGRDIAYVTWESRPSDVTLDTSICYETYRVLYCYCDGQSTELYAALQDITLLSVANNCLCIYAKTDEDIISLNQSGIVTVIKVGTQPPDGFLVVRTEYLNADHTQLLYYTEEGTMLSISGQPGQKISEKNLYPVRPDQTKLRGDGGITFDIADFTNALFLERNVFSSSSTGYSLWNLDAEGTAVTLAKNVISHWLDPSGTTLFCQQLNSTLLHIAMDTEASTVIAEDVTQFAPSFNSSHVYYVSNDTLYVSDTNDEGYRQKISSGTFDKLLPCRAGILCFLQNDSLYVYTGTGSPSLGLSNVEAFNLSNCGVLYVQTDNGLYMAEDSGDFKRFGTYYLSAAS